MTSSQTAIPSALIACFLLAAVPVVAVPLGTTTVMGSPMRIMRLANDPWEGGVWIGTEGGLVFKDLLTGELRHYSLGQGMPHFVVLDVAVESDRVWIGTGWGMAVLDKRTQVVQTVSRDDGTPVLVGARTVFAEDGAVWMGTDDRGLFRIDRETLLATAVLNPVNGSAFEHPIYGIGALGDELYISATGYGLVRWDRASGQSWLYDDAYFDSPKYGRIDVSPQEIWIGSGGEGAFRLDRTNWGMDQYASPATVNAHIVYRPVKAFGSVWFPTLAGVAAFEPAGDTWRYWHEVPGGSALNELVLAQGELYGATEVATIVRYDRASREWMPESWWAPNQVMVRNSVQTCDVEPDGRILFGTGGGGANLYDPVAATWTALGQEPGSKGRPNDINIVDTENDGRTRFFAHYHGISEMDLASGEYLHYHVDGRGARDTQWGFDLARDVEVQDDAIWVGVRTNFEEDPLIWHPGKVTRVDRATHQQQIFGEEAGLTEGNVTEIALDGDLLWIGMKYGGLDVLDTKTRTIEHVYPASGQLGISEIVVRPDAIWMTTGSDVLRLDRETREVTTVAALAGLSPISLAWADGKLWLGTYYKGLYALDTEMMTARHFGLTGPMDLMIQCIGESDGLLYLGTKWGVERFDLDREVFLAQVARPSSTGTGTEPRPPVGASWVSITSPRSGASVGEGPITVSGNASTSADNAFVSVRVGDGDWTLATGVEDWTVTVDSTNLLGSTRIAARLQIPGALLALDAIYVAGPGSTTNGPNSEGAFLHDPLLEAWVGEPNAISLAAPLGLQDLSAVLQLRDVDGAVSSIPFAGHDGNLTAKVPAFSRAGSASYAIQVQWDNGSYRFPATFSDYGEEYPIVVRALDQGARPRIVDPGDVTVQSGVETNLTIQIQNPGSRMLSVRVEIQGEGVTGPETLTIPAGGSATLALRVLFDPAQAAAWRSVRVTLLPLAGGDDIASATFRLRVLDSQGHAPTADAPAFAWVAVAGLGIALIARRRRR